MQATQGRGSWVRHLIHCGGSVLCGQWFGEALKGALGSGPIRMSRPHVQRLTESPCTTGLCIYSSTGEDGQWKLVGQDWE